MPTWMLVDLPVVPCVGDAEELTAEAIEAIDEAFWFAWSDERNLVALCDSET